MNNIAISPYIGMHALQIQNVKRNVVKKASIDELNKSNTVILENNDIKNEEVEEANKNQNQNQNHVLEKNEYSNTTDLPEPLSNNIGSEI
jgi:hypothetical protein